MKKIIVVTPTFNEEENVENAYKTIKEIFNKIGKYDYNHLFIDNCSTDKTQNIIRKIADGDKNVLAIFNRQNYGQNRSPFHAITQCYSDAVIYIDCDLQDPPEKIIEFIDAWENGNSLVLGVKKSSKESKIIYKLREFYYGLLNLISTQKLQSNFCGFGLFDKKIVDFLRTIDDPDPYLRGLLIESGFKPFIIFYDQEVRKRGVTKNNFFTLYDLAMLGITSYSKIPLRIIIFTGFVFGFLSFFFGLFYFIYKIIFWNSFETGIAPIIILVSFFFFLLMFFIGILAEYILSIHQKLYSRKIVIEKERINF